MSWRTAVALLAALSAPSAAADPRLLGDAGGARTRLQRLGVGVQLFYNQYVSGNPRGGADPRQVGHSGSYDFFARADGEALMGWRGGVALLHLKGQYDRNVNADVGALSDPIDDADFDEPVYVSELWLEQVFARERARVRAGFLEMQTIFDRNAYANFEDRQFFTTFLDNNPLIPLTNGLGAVLLVRPAGWVELAAGVADADNAPRSAGFDTAFDGVDSLNGYLEATFTTRLGPPERGLRGRYRVGVFLDGRDRRVLGTGRTERGHLGAWLSIDQPVWRARSGEGPGVGVFARAGWADEDTSPLAWFWSGGLEAAALLPGRDRDVFGIGAYGTIASRRVEDRELDRETGIEVYYRIALLPWLEVTPDVQYVIDPGGRGGHGDAVVTSMRFRVSF